MTILAAPPSSSDESVPDVHDDNGDVDDVDDDDDDSFGPAYPSHPKHPNNGSSGSSKSRPSAKPKKDPKSARQPEPTEPFTPSYALRSLGSLSVPNGKSSTSTGAARSAGVSGTLNAQERADKVSSQRESVEESSPPTVPFEANTVTVLDLGSIKASPNFYTRKSLYPVGYKSSRLYTSIFRLEFVFSPS